MLQLLLLIIFQIIRCEIVSVQFGCIDTACTKLCNLGIADCVNFKCEFGYFQFTDTKNSNALLCLPCPYKFITDDLSLYCQDCYQDPYQWESNRTCTYYYQIEDGDPTNGAYLQKTMNNKEIYYIAAATTQIPVFTNRVTNIKLEPYQCQGCKEFCNDADDSTCHIVDKDYVNKGFRCDSSYYFDGNICSPCIDGCETCTTLTDCEVCKEGYAYDDFNYNCIKCFNGCKSCYAWDGATYCQQCTSQDIGNYQVPSLDQSKCVSCHPTCARCEFVDYEYDYYPTREQDWNDQGTLRCRQCLYPDSTLNPNGISCDWCQIGNCNICYYKIDDTTTTLDIDFQPKSVTPEQTCFQCKSGFVLSADKQTCTAFTPTDNCVSKDSSGNCLMCKDNYILNKSQTPNACQDIKCEKKILNCLDCYAYLNQAEPYVDDSGTIQYSIKPAFQCIKCKDGYYPNLQSGTCAPCQSNCKTCWEYTLSYNITGYLQLQIIPKPSDIQVWFYESLERPLCTECKEGFNIYDNTCSGCTGNCFIKDPSGSASSTLPACVFTDKLAFCSKCLDPTKQRSLNDDNSECWDCPDYCLACRTRTDEEMQVNPNFSPSSTLLEKYGRICYSYQTTEAGVFMDTQLGVPVKCLSLPTNAKCYNKQSISVSILCDDFVGDVTGSSYQIKKFYPKQDNQGTIKFNKDDNYQSYIKLNSNAVRELDFIVNLVHGPCTFYKPTVLTLDFLKNVFTLQRVNLIIQGESTVQLGMYGALNIYGANTVTLKNIQGQYYSTSKPKDKSFGIRLISPSVSQLKLENVIFSREYHKESTSQLVIQVDNPNLIQFNNVKFQNLDNVDKIIETNFTIRVTEYQVILQNVIFTDPYQQNNILFPFVGNAIKQQIIINNLQIIQGYFNNSQLINSEGQNSYLDYDIQNVKLIFLELLNSTFIYSDNFRQGKFYQFDVIQCRLNQSEIIQVNVINITKYFSNLNILLSNSIEILNVDQLTENLLTKQYIQYYNLNTIRFVQNKCSNINCLIRIFTPLNEMNIITSLTIIGLELNSIITDNIPYEQVQVVQSALCYFTSLDKIVIENVFIDRTRAITIIYFSDLTSLSISKISYDWTLPINITNPNTKTQVRNPKNNLIPSTIECAQRKINYRSYSYYLIFVNKFKLSVQIQYLKVQRQLSIDASIIYIESYDVQEFNTTTTIPETINLNNIQFYNNSLVSQTNGLPLSLIQIKSTQLQNVTINEAQFMSNHLQVLINKQTATIGTLFNIDSPLSWIVMKKMTIDFNRICNSESGLMSIQTQNLMFSSNTITNTNILDRNWLNLLEEHQLVNDIYIQNFFEIRSIGSILNIVSAMASFQSDKYINSFGVQAGIYIQTDKVGQLNFQQCQFENMKSSLELKYSSNGGALYIDSSLSQLSLSMSSIIMNNCMSRLKGGCIFINPSNQKHSISISDSSFNKCMAIEHSFMSVEFSDSIIPPQVKFETIVIQNNNYDWFLSNLPQIQSSDLLYFTSTASIYYQSGGGLLLKDVQFFNHKLSSIIQLNRMLRIQIDGLNIQDSKIFLNSIISITLIESSNAQLILADSKITNITEIDATQQQQSCDSLMKSQQIYITITQNCEQIIANQEIADEIEAIDEIYELYSDNVLSQYNSLNDNKYLISYLSYPIFNQNISIIELFQDTNFNLITCLQNNIYYLSKTISTGIYTALFQISKTLTGQKISMQVLTITNNQCYKCTGGLGQFRNIQANVQTTPAIEIVDFSCTNNTIGYYGCLSFTNHDSFNEITINQEIVNQPISSSTSRLLEQTSIISQLQVIQIRQSKFKQNYAKVGGGLNIVGTTVLILNTQFTDNQASLVGGAIFFKNSSNNNLYLYTNVFSGNKAQVGGGLYLQDYTLANTNSLGVVFELNTAEDGGSNIQELTHRLSIQLSNQPFKVQTYMNYSGDSNGDGVIDNSSVIIKDNITDSLSKVGSFEYFSYYLEMPSGQAITSYKYFYEYTQEQIPFEWVFRLINLNRQGDIVANGQAEDSCDIEGRIQFEYSYDDKKAYTNNFTRPNKVYYDVQKEAYDMDDLVIIFDPYFLRDYYLELRFICKAVKIPIYNTQPPYEITSFNHNYQLYARVRTFPCQKGEIYDANQCKACLQSDNTYNIIKNANICKQIDRLAMNAVSPAGYNLKKGYWRPNYDNDNYESCYNLKSSCLGGWVPGNPSCYTGHIGALCESCDIYAQYNDERWANSAPYICGKCASTRQLNIVIIVAMTIVTLISVISSVKGTYEALQLQIVEEIINKMGFRLKSDSSNLATIIKTLTNYFQIIQIISTFQLELPSAVSDTAKTAGNPTGSMASNLDCLLVEMTDIEIVYFKMIWALIMPTMYLTIFLIGYFMIILFQITKFTVSIIYTAFIYLFLYMHPTLVQGFISLASSRTVSGLPWLKSDVGYRYDTQQQDIWMIRFIGPMLLLWVLVLPCLFMLLVWSKRKELDLKSTKMRLGYFYKEYSRESYLWEFVKIFQKESMVIALVYYDEFVVVKGLLIVLILFLYGWYQVSVTPYSSLKLNITDRYSTVICGASLCLGVLMYGSLKGGLYYLVYIILFIILIINIWFILMCIFQIFEGYLVKLADVLDKGRDVINEKYPDLRDKGPRIRRLLRNQGKFRVRVKYLWGLLKEKVQQAEKIQKKHKHLFFQDAFEIVCEVTREKKDKQQNSPSPILILSQVDEEREDILKQ